MAAGRHLGFVRTGNSAILSTDHETQPTPWAIKKRDTFIFVITLASLTDFRNFFTSMYNNELRNKNLNIAPP